jgi:hypothetical protein
MSKPSPRWRDRALVLEFWIVLALACLPFLVGGWRAVRALLG